MPNWRNEPNEVDGLEQRVREGSDAELRASGGDGGPGQIEGHALTFGDEYRVADFVERIDSNAVNRDTDLSDVRVLLNHDPSAILGRTQAGTATVEKDSDGLRYTADLPDSDVGHRTMEAVMRGDIDASSFGFRVAEGGESWDRRSDGTEVRTITQISEIFDAGPVVFPANTATSAAARDIVRAGPAEASYRAWRKMGRPEGFCGIRGEEGCPPSRQKRKRRPNRGPGDRHRTAKHEAAHAVVAFAQGVPIHRVSADPNDGNLLVAKRGAATPEVAMAPTAIGRAASERDRDVASRGIREKLGRRHTDSMERAEIMAAEKRAKKILGRHFGAWSALSATLARRGEMTGDEVEAYLAQTHDFASRTYRPQDHRFAS